MFYRNDPPPPGLTRVNRPLFEYHRERRRLLAIVLAALVFVLTS